MRKINLNDFHVTSFDLSIGAVISIAARTSYLSNSRIKVINEITNLTADTRHAEDICEITQTEL